MKYKNTKTGQIYYEGSPLTCKLSNGVFSGIPTEDQLIELGYEPYIEEPMEPSEESIIENRITEIRMELSNTDYLEFKALDGEDMTQYGDWQETRRQLRRELRTLLGEENPEI